MGMVSWAGVVLLAWSAAAALPYFPCDSISDPNTCVDTAHLTIHMCTWCAAPGKRGCHLIGTDSACPSACCVGKGSASDCNMTSIAALATVGDACPGAVARVRTAARDDAPAVGRGVGLAFSGGGSRAFSYTMGWVRGLVEAGLWLEDAPVASVSGSGWFLGPFLYGGGGEADVDLFGAYVAPENLTLAALKANAGSMAQLPDSLITKCLALFAERLVTSSEPLQHVWRDAVYEIFLEPSKVGSTQTFFHDRDAAADAAARNPEVFAAEAFPPALPRRDPSPVLYHVGTLEGPVKLLPLANNTYLPFAMGPRFSGTGPPLTVPYAEHWPSTAKGDYPLGGFVETWALGATPVGTDGDLTLVVLNENLFSLNSAVGIASMAPATLLTHLPVSRRLDESDDGDGGSGLLDLVPTKRIYAPGAMAPAAASPPPFMALGDGGDLENFGILHLLQRGYDTLVIFNAAVDLLAPRDKWNPFTTPPTAELIDLYIPALFGIDVDADVECNTRNNHVFETEGLARLVDALQVATATGTGGVGSVEVTTVENALFGVEGGKKIDLTMVYLDTPGHFIASLPKETADAIAADTFGGFPNWGTITHLDLSPDQVALAAQLGSWYVHENYDLLASKLKKGL